MVVYGIGNVLEGLEWGVCDQILLYECMISSKEKKLKDQIIEWSFSFFLSVELTDYLIINQFQIFL